MQIKFNINTLTGILLIYLPDFIIIAYITDIFLSRKNVSSILPGYVFFLIIIIIIIKDILLIITYKRHFTDKIKEIVIILEEFKKGKFASQRISRQSKDKITNLSNDLSVIGKYIDNIISKLKDEIKILRELYNNIVFSISSYLIILNEKREIIFANDVFCKKFQLDLDEIIGKNIDDIFLFVADNLRDSIRDIYTSQEPIVLEKTHLLSKNWISVIVDIKISSMIVQSDEQIILIIDDITSKCRKDYQINLISQVSGSIQRDEEIHKILYTILFGITSGAGLGFNRAMLFLQDQKNKYLIGEIAVGPDSMEEAIEIWNSMPAGSVDIVNLVNTIDNPHRKGTKLLQKVINTKIEIDTDNIFARSFKSLENIHIYNSFNDSSIDDNIKNFMDVAEFVIVPLIVENRAIGIIVADNKYNQIPIGNEHIELLSIFAVQASLLIESYQSVSTLKKEMDKIRNKQEAMIESEKLAAIGRISSHIAHEIRNPLVTMGGYARRIRQIADGDDKITHAANVILKETIRLENILSNVMDLTKPQALIKELTNINEIIRDTIDLLKNVFMERRINIFPYLSTTLPLVNADPNQIKQVILNLLQNSIDAISEEGEIEIFTGVDDSDDTVFITIGDTGIGIESENLENIFEPFFTTKITGVGLGLAIVHRIIKDHNGDITAKNLDKGGTEFTIKLPYSK